MLKLFVLLLACFASAADLSAQILIFDRGLSSESNQSLGLPKQAEGFLADDFQVGAAKEDWVIDHIRLWAVPDPKATSPRGLGDLFRRISLYGGIAPDPPPPGQKADTECDCHNLPALKTAVLEAGGDSTDNPDVKVASDREHGPYVWQIDFEDLKWSVPGGTSIQFGVLADAYAGYTWYGLASPDSGDQHLRVFSSAGKLQSSFHAEFPARINIQVWGHLLARISIRPAGERFKVILWSLPFLERSQVDASSVRFGPRNASPESVSVEDVNHDGKDDLVMDFRAADSGLAPKSINACLTGRRLDGAPFEGCDLLKH